MLKLIKLKDCYIDEIEYDSSMRGGCPTCHCGGETIADLTFYLETNDYVSICNIEEDCLGTSNKVFREADCMKILGSREDFSYMTLFEFIGWFCGELRHYLKIKELEVEFNINNKIDTVIYKFSPEESS